MYVYLGKGLVPEEDACIRATDRGFLLGDGVFETLRVYGGVPFRFDRHMQRLRSSAELMELHLPIDEGELGEALRRTLKENNLSEAVARITISRGPGPPGLSPRGAGPPTVLITARHFGGHPQEYYRRGMSLMVSDTRRTPPSSQDPRIKSTSFMNNLIARIEADRAGADDALMLNVRDEITECTVSNIFFVSGGVVHTPSLSCGILEGVTRNAVIECMVALGIESRQGVYTLGDLAGAEEVFLTGSSIEVMPVQSVEGMEFPVREGGLVARIHEAFRRVVDEHVAREWSHWRADGDG